MPLLPAAIGIVLNASRTHVLLIKRKDIPIWTLPGGGIEEGEIAEEAVKREVWEETGFEIAIERQCAEYTPVNRWSALTSVFLCQIVQGQATLSDETLDVQFHSLQQLPSSFFSIHQEWLQEALTHTGLVQKPLSNTSYQFILKYALRHPKQVLLYLCSRLKAKVKREIKY